MAFDSGTHFGSACRSTFKGRGDESIAARKSIRVNRKYKTKHRVSNWQGYERGLRNRGDVTVWLSEEAIGAWRPPKNGLRGGQRRYSTLAILIRCVPKHG